MIDLAAEAVGPGGAARLGAAPRYDVLDSPPDGAAGIEITCSSGPNAIVIDMSMPGMSGREAIPALYRTAPDAAIVIYSSEPPGPSDELVVGGEVDGVVRKSPNVGELIQALSGALGTG